MTDLIRKAITIATERHAGQVDKAGKPYIGHVARVASRVPQGNEAAVIAAWLHDTVEDTRTTEEEIAEKFGEEIRDAVRAVTKTEEEERTKDYDAFIARAAEHPIGRLVKIADLQDNLDPDRAVGRTTEMEAKYKRALAALGTLPRPDRPMGVRA